MSYTKLLRWMSRGGLFTLLVIVLVVWKASVTSTQGPLAQKNEPSPTAEIKRPIISMMVASSIDEKGKLVNPRFTFPPNEPRITVVVWVGKIKGSELKITWYKKSETGHETLFDHKIQVKSNDHAYSVAENASGTLELGTYKVVADLEGQTEEIEFDISPPQIAPEETSNSRDDELFEDQARSRGTDGTFSVQKVSWDADSRTAPATQAGSAVAKGKRPVAGSSGTTPQPPRPSSASGCSFDLMNNQGDSDDYVQVRADILDMYQGTYCPSSETAQVHFSAGIVGAQERYYGHYTASSSRVEFPVNPCELPSDSDLPGTKVSVKASWVVLGNTPLTTKSEGRVENIITLGRDTFAPIVSVVSTPARGNAVQEGDQINFQVTANETRSGESWQTGVKEIQIEAIPGSIKQWRNPSEDAKPCTQKTWEHTLGATYTVPKNPPSTIKFCARAADYAPNRSQDLCGEFPVIPKSVMPANCKNKGSAHVDWKDGSPAIGAFDSKSPNYEMVECHFRFGICKKGYAWTHVGKNADGCQGFFDSAMAKLPKEQFCCDCYPECASEAPSKRKKR